MPEKQQIIRLLQLSYDEIDHFIDGMSAEERATSGAANHWNPRDILAHMFHWQRHNAEKLAAVRIGQVPPEDSNDIDAINAEIFQQHCHQTWDELAGFIAQARQMFLHEVEALSQENLSSSTYAPWSQGRPVWREILGDGFVHSMSHLSQACIDRGDLAEAERLRLQEAELLTPIDTDLNWQANISYNLACHFALVGEKEKALRYLEPAFLKRPNLAAWSQQDTDLRSLHGDPDFMALAQRYQ